MGGQPHVLLSPCIPWYTDGGQGHVLNTLYLSASESVKKQAQYKKYLKMKSETVVSLRKQRVSVKLMDSPWKANNRKIQALIIKL